MYHCVQLKPYRCMRIAQPLLELWNPNLPLPVMDLKTWSSLQQSHCWTYLQGAGVDTDIFKAHLVWALLVHRYSAAWSGMMTTDILNAADWSLTSETTFFNSFVIEKLRTGLHLDQLSCRLLMLQTFMLICKQSLLKCNLWMVQGMQCLHAICNYMRKVKLKY